MLLRRRSDKAAALAKVPLFADLPKRHIDALAKQADEVESKAGAVLVRQGEIARELILIVDGSARVERDGRVISHLGTGDFLGEMALLDGKPRSATVITDSPSTLLVIEGRSFWPLLESTPGVQKKMLIAMAGRIRDLQETLLD